MSFLFTVAISGVSLATVAVSCEMAARSLDMAVAKFAMSFTLSWQMYPSSGIVVALYAALYGAPVLFFNREAPLPVGGGDFFKEGGAFFFARRPLVPLLKISREHFFL